MRGTKFSGVAISDVLFVVITLVSVAPAGAQETSASQAAAASVARTATALKELGGTGVIEGEAALKAAEALAKAAAEAATAATAAANAAKNTGASIEDVKKASAAAVAAGQTMATASTTATTAGVTAAGKVVTEPARSRASNALTSALTTAQGLAKALAAAQEANTTAAAAANLNASQTATATVADQMEKAATAASTVALEVMNIGTEALAPALPIYGERDEHVLAAIRARITGGAIFFNGPTTTVKNADGTAATLQSNQFSQAATYLAFESQPRLFSGRNVGSARGYHRFYMDPFVNVRLTTIPLAGARPETNTITAPSQAFLQSQKAVQLQIGGVATLNFGGFEVQGTRFHWGIGPTARFTFQNVTDSQRALRLWDLDNDLFKQPSGGLRATIYQHDAEVGDYRWNGWIPAAYLDASLGKFENFERATGLTDAATSCLQAPSQCLVRDGGVPPRDEFEITSDWRWYLEGRVHLKYLYLGFDLNTGSGPDDLRFIGGLTVRLSQFFTRRD